MALALTRFGFYREEKEGRSFWAGFAARSERGQSLPGKSKLRDNNNYIFSYAVSRCLLLLLLIQFFGLNWSWQPAKRSHLCCCCKSLFLLCIMKTANKCSFPTWPAGRSRIAEERLFAARLERQSVELAFQNVRVQSSSSAGTQMS